MDTVLCRSCGASLDGSATHEPAPCPSCGSTLRIFQQHLSGTLTMRGGLRGVAYRISKSKWFTKFMAEPSFTHRLGIWSRRLKMEDKRSDKYLEVVTNPETGEILHKCEEPLSQHQGHGSAKQKLGTGNDG
jgi:hypothetical protein